MEGHYREDFPQDDYSKLTQEMLEGFLMDIFYNKPKKIKERGYTATTGKGGFIDLKCQLAMVAGYTKEEVKELRTKLQDSLVEGTYIIK